MYKYNQLGMTGLGWITILALIMFFALITIRLVPVYMEAFKVNTILESLEREPRMTQKSNGEIMRLITNRFSVDAVRFVNPNRDIFIENENGILTIEADYEIRTPMFGNIDVVAHFSKSVEFVEQ